MAASPKIKQFLDREGVSYEVSEHPLAYTATDIAGVQHIPGKQMVKSVIVKSGKECIMCVLPAIHLVDFEKLKKLTGLKDLILAEEKEIGCLFPDFELGAEPPFGNLFGLKIFADKLLEEDEEIVFNAGTHTDVIRMKYTDYKKLASPIVGEIGTHI